jgi:hypothetical protein
MRFEEILSYFDVKTGNGKQYMAICPSHPDNNPSLSIGYKDGDGKTVIFCQQGCKTEDVLNSKSLKLSDLFDEPLKKNELSQTKKQEKYIYVDENNQVKHTSVRYYKGNVKKFFQERINSKGEWLSSLSKGNYGFNEIYKKWEPVKDGKSYSKTQYFDKIEKTYLYRLPELIQAVIQEKQIYIVEGEKDVETLYSLGLVATCNPMGANKWKEHYNQFFNNANVVIIADNDITGQKHAIEVYNHIKDVAKSVKVACIEGNKKGYDVSDFIAEGGTAEGLKAYVEHYNQNDLFELVKAKEQEPKQLKLNEDHQKQEPKQKNEYQKLGIVEENGKYKKYTQYTNGDIGVEILSPFIIKPIETIKSEDASEVLVEIQYKGKTYKTTMTTKMFSTPISFRERVANIIGSDVFYLASAKDHQKILRLISSKDRKEITGVKCSGFHNLSDKWEYVTKEGVLGADGDIGTNIKILESSKEIDNPKIINQETLTELEIILLDQKLFKFNELEFTSTFLSYISAIFLKERFYKEIKNKVGESIKFPHLFIIGKAGSGKSATIENIGMSILNMSKNNDQVSANNYTKFTALKKTSSSNTAPLIINEYRPWKLSQWVLDDIDNLINNLYDRYSSSRGRADQTVINYNPLSPLILIGEGFKVEASSQDRIIKIHSVKEKALEKKKQFEDLLKHEKLLNKLGKTLLIKALEISSEKLQELFRENEEYLNFSDIETTRGKNSLACLCTGVDLLNIALNDILTVSDTIKRIKESIVSKYKKDTLEGGISCKSVIGETLERISQLIHEGELQEGIHFSRYEKECDIALDVKTIWGIMLENTKKQGLKMALSEKDFISQLKREEYYKQYTGRKLGIRGTKKSVKCFVLHLQKLIDTKLEISDLTGVDIEEEFESQDNAI